jgi:hypothetical protein
MSESNFKLDWWKYLHSTDIVSIDIPNKLWAKIYAGADVHGWWFYGSSYPSGFEKNNTFGPSFW